MGLTESNQHCLRSWCEPQLLPVSEIRSTNINIAGLKSKLNVSVSSALKLSAQCNKLEQDISLSVTCVMSVMSPGPVHKSTQMASGSGQYFSHSYDRGSGKLPAAGISVSQDSSQRSPRVNCQSQTFLHCPGGSFDRVQCLMPGSGVMRAGRKSFDHKRHCVREPGVTSRQIKCDDFLTLVLSS